MEMPFVFGKVATGENFTDRSEETERLLQNFRGLVNTTIISPRRWGKSSLVARVAELIQKQEKSLKICMIDLFNVRTEEEFYTLLANSILKAVSTKWEEIVADAKHFLGRLVPRISFSTGQDAEVSFGVSWEELQRNPDEVLDLAEALAEAKGIRVMVCVDEFQNVAYFDDALAFQKKLRAHWQRHSRVGYCLFGSKRHMLLEVFADPSMPFYKFGDLLFLQKIAKVEWIPFIQRRFEDTGKTIDTAEAGRLVDLVDNHPYYVQQLAQQVWLRTSQKADLNLVEAAYNGLIDQLSLLFLNLMETFSNAQIAFLHALIAGEKQLSSKRVLQKYTIGTSGNVVRIRQNLIEREILDTKEDALVFQDPLFEGWLRKCYFKCGE